jgi:hypothetical protein
MYNFFVNVENKQDDTFLIKGSDYNHLINVLRFKKGDEFLVTCNGVSNLCLLEDYSSDTAFAKIENKNLLVQGVAGSGKTNVCLSKIIFVACKNYTGKILYTTFSRGLLIDTRNKIEIFKNNIKNFINDYKNNRIIFLDRNHKKAIENRLGIYLIVDSDSNILKKLYQIVEFLETHIDYHLIEDIYTNAFGEEIEICDESIFLNDFLKNINNHQLKSRLEKLKNLSYQVIYKEIYGMIFGCSIEDEMVSLDYYKKARQNSF